MTRSLALILSLVYGSLAGATTFTFHLFSEPHTLDPHVSSSSISNYLFNNIYRGLYSFDQEKGLVLEGAQSCRREKQELKCALRDDHRWSDGTPVVAEDYVRSFRKLISPDAKSPNADLLLAVKNAKAVLAGELPVDQLGVSAPSEKQLVIRFDVEDPEFEYKLIHPSLSPMPAKGYPSSKEASSLVTSGPYAISHWQKGAWVKLVNNPHFFDKTARPEAQAFFIEQDSTALRMYESGRLSFLRRLPAGELMKRKGRKDFYQFPMARFDYIGFGPALLPYPKAREALIKSVEFTQFLQLFDTISPPGCPSLPKSYMSQTHCLASDRARARELWRTTEKPDHLEFQFSLMGGDDIARAAEWFQGQWSKNLNAKIVLQGQEQGVYLRKLRDRPPAIFRKGVTLDRPTCLAAVELFTKGHPENYIGLSDAGYDRAVQRVRDAKAEADRKKACAKAVQHLLSTHRLIPLGEMYFTMLARPEFKGWAVNSLNQLNLTRLTTTTP